MRVCAATLSLTPHLQYDGRIEEARAPPPEAREAQALTLQVGDRAVWAGCWLERLEPSPDDGVDATWRGARGAGRHAGRPAGRERHSTRGWHQVAPAGVADTGHTGWPR